MQRTNVVFLLSSCLVFSLSKQNSLKATYSPNMYMAEHERSLLSVTDALCPRYFLVYCAIQFRTPNA